MNGGVVAKAIVCGSVGVPGYQPSAVEEGENFVVRIVQALMDGARVCEQPAGTGGMGNPQ